MPRLDEIRIYMIGIWLLFQKRKDGFGWLDTSSAGVQRSFWAFVWCMPASLISWISWRSYYLATMPEGTPAGLSFFIRLFTLDVLSWLLPIVLLVVLARPLGFDRQLGVIVTVTNWVSVPLSYLLTLPVVLIMAIPQAQGFAGLLQLFFLGFCVAALYRLINMILGAQPLLAAALTALFIITPLVAGEPLRHLMELYPA